ncbi:MULTISPECIES: hypothetical protein [unclassified Meridianimarinicoccus]|uniref:hypothetical protein n=1 Tax=unclassified Meridianimarinicoccus TaxID=2923344 RepID=UPI001868AF79|nr:hypothetical protein [Fluviibacterium sp. MJW13]
MKVAHFICKRSDNGPGLKNVEILDKTDGTWRSGKWDMSLDDARSLIDGRIYLHETKASPSAFGGTVIDVEPVHDSTLAHPDRVWFIFRPSLEDKGVDWRGKDHAMASYGGIVEV